MKAIDQRLERLYRSVEKNSLFCRFLIALSIAISIIIIATVVIELISTKLVTLELFFISLVSVCMGVIIGLSISILFNNNQK